MSLEAAKLTTYSRQDKITAASTIEYFGLFDPLRAFLAFAVFVSHSELIPSPIENLGGTAVRVFFALSGFLVGGILLESAQRDNYWRGIPRFYFNRCIRIWIPYYCLIASYIALMLLRGFWSDELETRLIPLLTYTHNWANEIMGFSEVVRPIDHSWSLAVEEQFYLLCPLIIGLVRNRVVSIFAMGGLILASSFLLEENYFSAICLGVAAAAVHQIVSPVAWNWIRWTSLIIGPPLMTLLLTGGIPRIELLVAIASVMIVVGLSKNKTKSPGFYLLGGMSYSFYLFHWIGLYIATPIARLFMESHFLYVRAIIAFFIAVSISYASVKFLEWPLIARRNNIAARHPWLVNGSAIFAVLLTTFGFVWLSLR